MNVELESPQPGIWTTSTLHDQSGAQDFPTVSANNLQMAVSGRHVLEGASVYVNGRRVEAHVRCVSGELPSCDDEALLVELEQRPKTGLNLLQLQNPQGLFTNDFIFFSE